MQRGKDRRGDRATHKFTTYTQSSWENGIHEAVLAEMQNIPGFDPDQLTYQLTTTLDADNLARSTLAFPIRFALSCPGPGYHQRSCSTKAWSFANFGNHL